MVLINLCGTLSDPFFSGRYEALHGDPSWIKSKYSIFTLKILNTLYLFLPGILRNWLLIESH